MLENLAFLEAVETVVTQPVGSLLHRDGCFLKNHVLLHLLESKAYRSHFLLDFSTYFEHGYRSS